MAEAPLDHNPLLSEAPRDWDGLVRALDPGSLLVVIESRLGPAMRARLQPEDILQEALLLAWRDRASTEWRGLRAFRSFLLTIIDRRISTIAESHSTLKRGGGHDARPLDGAWPSDASASSGASSLLPPALIATTTPSRLAERAERAGAIRDALSCLPDDFREIVRLRLLEQLEIERIAERLALTHATVRHRLRRGAELYKRQLALSVLTRSQRISADSSSTQPPDPTSHD